MNKTADHPPVLASRPGRILVADDEEKNRRLLCDILTAQMTFEPVPNGCGN